jgi:hypothetical protein
MKMVHVFTVVKEAVGSRMLTAYFPTTHIYIVFFYTVFYYCCFFICVRNLLLQPVLNMWDITPRICILQIMFDT